MNTYQVIKKDEQHYCSSTGKPTYVFKTVLIVDKNEKPISIMFGDDKEVEIRAKLLASAPELLEALKEVTTELDSITDRNSLGVLNSAREVIAKAEGK